MLEGVQAGRVALEKQAPVKIVGAGLRDNLYLGARVAAKLGSWFKGKPAGDNPWDAKGLEWETTSPPPAFNFDRTPVVTESTHMYGHPEEVKVV